MTNKEAPAARGKPTSHTWSVQRHQGRRWLWPLETGGWHFLAHVPPGRGDKASPVLAEQAPLPCAKSQEAGPGPPRGAQAWGGAPGLAVPNASFALAICSQERDRLLGWDFPHGRPPGPGRMITSEGGRALRVWGSLELPQSLQASRNQSRRVKTKTNLKPRGVASFSSGGGRGGRGPAGPGQPLQHDITRASKEALSGWSVSPAHKRGLSEGHRVPLLSWALPSSLVPSSQGGHKCGPLLPFCHLPWFSSGGPGPPRQGRPPGSMRGMPTDEMRGCGHQSPGNRPRTHTGPAGPKPYSSTSCHGSRQWGLQSRGHCPS